MRRGAEGADGYTEGYRAALNTVASDVRALFVNYVHHKGADGLLARCKELHEQIAVEADRLLAIARSPAMAAEAVAWVRKHPDTGELAGDWLWDGVIEQCRKDSGVWFPLGFLDAPQPAQADARVGLTEAKNCANYPCCPCESKKDCPNR